MEAAYFSETDGFDPTLFELEGMELKAEHTDLVRDLRKKLAYLIYYENIEFVPKNAIRLCVLAIIIFVTTNFFQNLSFQRRD